MPKTKISNRGCGTGVAVVVWQRVSFPLWAVGLRVAGP